MKEILHVKVLSEKGKERLDKYLKWRDEGIKRLQERYDSGEFDHYFNK